MSITVSHPSRPTLRRNSFLKGVRSRGNNLRKVGIHFDYPAKPFVHFQTPPRREAVASSPTFTGTRRLGPVHTTIPVKLHPRIVPGLVSRLESVVVRVSDHSRYTLLVGRIDGNRRDFDKNLIPTNGGGGTTTVQSLGPQSRTYQQPESLLRTETYTVN